MNCFYKGFLLTLVLFFLTCIQVGATNVFNLDIKGIKLNDSISQIKQKIYGCVTDSHGIGGEKKITSMLRCRPNKHESYIVYVGNDDKAFDIERIKYFKAKPIVRKIEEQIYRKYGQPDKTAVATNSTIRYEKSYEYAWGDYDFSLHDGEYWKGSSVYVSKKGKALLISYKTNTGNPLIKFRLIDKNREEKFSNWLHATRKRNNEIDRRSESKLDL